MRKRLGLLLVSIFSFFVIFPISGCTGLGEALDLAFENECLSQENESLKSELDKVEKELATLKFETTFPNGLVTESCILENVNIKRQTVNTEGSVYAVRADGQDVEVTIKGGSYDAGSGSLYNIAVWAHNGSHIVIEGGEFITGNDVNGEFNHCVYAAGGSVIEIKGGTFESTGDSTWLLNCQDNNGTIIVTGGTFVNYNPAESYTEPNSPVSFVAEGYTVISEKKSNGDVLYTVVKA